MNIVYFIFQDYKNNKGNTKGRVISILYRLGNLSCTNRFYEIVLFPYRLFYKIFIEWVMGFEIPYKTKIGEGLKIYHLQSIVINSNAIIGKNCSFRHNLTIGNSRTGGRCPIIGNNVDIGASVCVIGDITIGDNVNIGAGSIVVKDVPSNCTIVGNPARIIKRHDVEE